MVTQLTQDVQTAKTSEGNIEGPRSPTKASQVVPKFISKRMIEHHERTDEIDDLLGALRFCCGPFTF